MDTSHDPKRQAHEGGAVSQRMPAAQREAIDASDGGALSAALEGSPRQAAQRRALGAAVAQRADDRGAPPNRTGLPDALKSGMESLSGMDLSEVRVHANSSQPAQLNALAYAQGNDIHLAPGQEQHLAHEAWHVVQQRQGRVQPTMQLAGVDINDNEALESEADRMGAQALQAGASSTGGA